MKKRTRSITQFEMNKTLFKDKAFVFEMFKQVWRERKTKENKWVFLRTMEDFIMFWLDDENAEVWSKGFIKTKPFILRGKK
jgi:hypothetical protein